MERISVFDMFKVGVGPSSSHTVGPWRAALDVLAQYRDREVKSIQVKLFGSLAKTGIGHGTDVAVMLGLSGYDPTTIDTSQIAFLIGRLQAEKSLPFGTQAIAFDPTEDIQFLKKFLPTHPNALRFVIKLKDKNIAQETDYYIGGGII